MFESPDLGNYPFTAPPGWGYSLPVVYLVWAFVVVGDVPAVPLVRARSSSGGATRG